MSRANIAYMIQITTDHAPPYAPCAAQIIRPVAEATCKPFEAAGGETPIEALRKLTAKLEAAGFVGQSGQGIEVTIPDDPDKALGEA